MTTIISAGQCRMLQALCDGEMLSPSELKDRARMGDNLFWPYKNDLIERGLIRVAVTRQGKQPMQLVIEGAGRLALQAYKHRHQEAENAPTEPVPAPVLVPAPYRCPWESDYKNTVPMYYRNNGNAHIKSRGLRC